MKILSLLFTGILLNNFPLAAQLPGCSQNTLVQTAGKWKESTNGSVSGIAAADLVKAKRVVASIHGMIKQQYTPMGVEADYAGAYNRPYPNMAANSYYYRIIPLNFYCEGGLLKTAHETSTYFQVAANMFEAEIYDTAQGDRLLQEGFNVMPDLPVAKDGYWYFKEKDANLGFGISGKSMMILVTYDGKLPYAYVSRREFLEKQKKIQFAEMATAAAGFKDALKAIETERGFRETEYKNDPEKLKQYLKKDYQYTKDRFEKLLAANENNYKPEFDKIEAQLKMPATELDQPAIVKKDPKAKLSSYLFTGDDDPFGKVLIKPNPGYFNKKLPRSAPQFFCVYIIWNHNEPIAANFKEGIMKAVDLTTLKNMIGK